MKAELLQICDRAHTIKLLCVGDIMLDQFVYGRVDRISPEAPIPVMRQTQTLTMLGAVGNVARNVSSLGGFAILAAAIGEDTHGDTLLDSISGEARIEGCLTRMKSRRTTLKTRYIASSQQLLRVDSEDRHPLSPEEEDQLCEAIRKSAEGCHGILVSDYAKGSITKRLVNVCLQIAGEKGIPLVVDPKGLDFKKYGKADVIKPNAKELALATGLPAETDDEVILALTKLMDETEARIILVTRSEKGLSFIRRGEKVRHMPTVRREVFDVSGAGDTSLAALGLGLATGADLEVSAEFALCTAGIAVGKVGTAAVTADEVRQDVNRRSAHRTEMSNASTAMSMDKIEEWRAQGLTVGFTNGCFDILHAGHLSVLEFAASHCDRLVVGLNSDASVKRLKGASRPVNSEQDRRALLLGLKPVDLVIVFEEDTPQKLIEKIRPSVLVKGGDYDPDSLVGADIVKAYGGRVLIAPLLDGRSTTSIIERSKSQS